MNDLTQRLTRLESHLAVDPNNTRLLFDAAELCHQFGWLEQARDFLERLFALEPHHTPAHALLGLIQLTQGQIPEAITTFRLLVNSGIVAAPIYYNLAYALLLDSRAEEAEPFARHAAAQLAELPVAGPLYVRALHHLGKLVEAIDFAEKAVTQHPDHLGLYGVLATLYLDNEDLSKAENFAKQVVTATPNDADAATVLGMLALAHQDAITALPYFQVAASKKPSNGRAWAGHGMAAMLQGNLASAAADLQQAVTYMPGHLGTWHALAWCQIFMKQPQEAQKTLMHALEMNRNFADTHGSLAIVAIMEGDLDAAEAASKRALGLNPNSFPGLYAQSLLLQYTNQPAQAQAIMSRLLNTTILQDGTTLQQAVARALVSN